MIINDKKPIYKAYFGDTQIITNVGSEGTGGGADGFDFSVLGYDTTLNNSCNGKIQADIDYSRTILDNWNPNTTNARNKFKDDTKLVYCPNIDTSNVTDMYAMFNGCRALNTIPLLDTSNVTIMASMFQYCSPLTTIPLLNTSKVTNMSYMFNGCPSLITIPAIDTSKVTNFKQFIDLAKLQSLPLLDMGSVSSSSNINNFFGYSTSNNTTLTEVGGFKNLKVDWTDNYGIKRLANLTYESVMNIINNLYDFRGNGDTATTRTIKFNNNSKALLSDADIAIATNKGWIIS